MTTQNISEIKDSIYSRKPGESWLDLCKRKSLYSDCLCNVDFIENSYWCNMDLSGAPIENSTLKNVNLKGSNLMGCKFNNSNLWGAHLSDCNLTGASFVYADLVFANLNKSNLTGSTFAFSKLDNAEHNQMRVYKHGYESCYYIRASEIELHQKPHQFSGVVKSVYLAVNLFPSEDIYQIVKLIQSTL